MQPFVELPIIIVNSEQESKDVVTRLQPGNIEYYYPGFYNGTVIVMKSANSFLTPLTIEEIDSMLLEYSRHVKSNTLKFGILQSNFKSKENATN